MSRAGRLTHAVLILFIACLSLLTLASPASALAPQSVSKTAPDILGCKVAPIPEMPGRGMVGFFESKPSKLPPAGNPFAAGAKTTTIYEQYGYAGLRWNTYDLGCGPDLARAPDASVGTAVANWMFNLPKTAVAATGAVVGQAFAPDFLAFFDPLIGKVVDGLRHAVFEQWFVLVIGALGLLLIWKARQASLASSASAIGWAILVMVLVTMVFRWPLVAGHAADRTVTGTLATVNSGLNGSSSSNGDAGSTAIAGMQEALLYRAWLGGTFGDADSQVAKSYGPQIFDSQALTWREAQIVQADPKQGEKIIAAKKAKFVDVAAKIANQDPDAYEYLTGRRSDSRVGYSLLAGIAALCAVPFLLIAGLLVLGALVIVRFGVMLFPAFATLGLFPTMRGLVTGIGSTVAAAVINALIFGIGAAVTLLGMGVLLGPGVGAAWLQIVLMLLLTIVMWVALSPFRRLTQMVSSRNHFAIATGGVGAAGRGAARTSGRILSGAIGTFLGVSAAQRVAERQQEEPESTGVPQRAEASTSYLPIVNDDYVTAHSAAIGTRPGIAEGQPAALASSAASRAVRIDSRSVTVVQGRDRSYDLGAEEIYTPAARSRAESHATGVKVGARTEPARNDAAGGRFESGVADGEETGAGRLESDRSIGIGRAREGARPSATRVRGDRSSGGRSSTDDVLQPAPRQDYGVAIGPASRERHVPAERREATSARDRLRQELESQSDADIDELSEVFRPAPSPERTRT